MNRIDQFMRKVPTGVKALCSVAIPLLCLGLETSCSKGSNQSSSTTPSTETISGRVTAGNTAGADVNVYALNSDGSRGQLLGNTKTATDGAFTITFTSTTGSVEVEAKNGTYKDEATSKNKTLATPMISILGKTDRNNMKKLPNSRFAVSPITSAASAITKKSLAARTSKSKNYLFSSTSFKAATPKVKSDEALIAEAMQKVLKATGISGLGSPTTAVPDMDIPCTQQKGDAKKMCQIITTQSQLAKEKGTDPATLAKAMGNQLASGQTSMVIIKTDESGNPALDADGKEMTINGSMNDFKTAAQEASTLLGEDFSLEPTDSPADSPLPPDVNSAKLNSDNSSWTLDFTSGDNDVNEDGSNVVVATNYIIQAFSDTTCTTQLGSDFKTQDASTTQESVTAGASAVAFSVTAMASGNNTSSFNCYIIPSTTDSSNSES